MKPALGLAVNVTVVSGCTQRETEGAVDVVATPPLLAIVPEIVMSHHSSTFRNVKSTPPSQEAPPLLLLLLLVVPLLLPLLLPPLLPLLLPLLLLLVVPQALLHWVHALPTAASWVTQACVSSAAHADASAPSGHAQVKTGAHAVSTALSWDEQLVVTHDAHVELMPVEPTLGQLRSEYPPLLAPPSPPLPPELLLDEQATKTPTAPRPIARRTKPLLPMMILPS
jgi:hypothetical protein